jgi:acetyltransferase
MSTLSEHASKALLAEHGVPLAREAQAADAAGAVRAAESIGFPVAVKLSGDGIAHKTERGLVRLGLADAEAVRAAAEALLAEARPEDGDVRLLVAEMLGGARELIAGVARDPQFGPCVLLGLGGILTEAVGDAVFAVAPLSRAEALAMLDGLGAQRLLGAFRGEPPLDREAVARPVAVDALVELGEPAALPEPRAPIDPQAVRERFRPLFHPRGIVVAGVSSHPGKFGFVAYHNLLRCGYTGELFPVKPDGAEVLGRPTYRDVSEIPDARADLVFVCTPNKVNVALLEACAAKGVRAAFVASAGYGEAGEEGRALERELVEAADRLGIILAGPNGQGVISTAESMCAQIVAPYPPPGRIGLASQSGNLVSAFLNYAVETGVGVSVAVSAGNSAQISLADYLDYFAADPDTAVGLGYLEGVADGRRFLDAARRLTAEKPLVLLKGGVASEGQRAAASHTGSLATDDRVFDGVCRQLGILRAPSVEEAFEWAATFATQPLPRGRRVVVFTTAGGWGVLAADACAAAGLELIPLPEELRAAIDEKVPARWSRNNPIDLAGGETRDTVPEVLDRVCAHPDVDAVIHLGIGIQAGQAQLFRSGSFHPDHGLDRISDYHERQDRRYAQAAREASERHGKPVLTCTELAVTDRLYGNAGPEAVKQGGRLCYASAHRAVRALAALVRYANFRARPRPD